MKKDNCIWWVSRHFDDLMAMRQKTDNGSFYIPQDKFDGADPYDLVERLSRGNRFDVVVYIAKMQCIKVHLRQELTEADAEDLASSLGY